jgi:hypothetical protein
MLKYKILGGENILLGLFFISIIISGVHNNVTQVPLWSLIRDFSPNIIFLCCFITNFILAYKLLVNKNQKLPFYIYLILTQSTIFWFFLLFIGYFFASHTLFPVVAFGITILIFVFMRKISHKIAITLTLITLLVSLIVIISSFEEDYCVKKGITADKTGLKMIPATKQDTVILKEFNIKPGDQIGVNFRTHMLCHHTFNLLNAMKDKYFSLSNTTPPGCNKTNAIGGCFGKNKINDFNITGTLPSCLSIKPHICQGAQIEIENLCPPKTRVSLEHNQITDKYTYMSFKHDLNGNNVKENPISYPTNDEDFLLEANVNNKPFQISYIKTKAWCK